MTATELQRITRRELRERFTAGARFEVTNHYITNPDNPCGGTSERVVLSASSAGMNLSIPCAETMRRQPSGSRVEWPKATQVGVAGDGSVVFWHEVDAAGTLAPFLTFREVDG